MKRMAEKLVAEYLRLSIEDGDVISNDNKAESDSISNQRELITRYRSDRMLYPDAQVLEFVDDGYSGTNFERPALKQMLSLIREGKICCVIVKDISRFGRNYLEVGDYLEQIFPFMGVRFIAINDYYDSDDYLGTTGGIEVAFKSLLYDMYRKDLSVKMNSALQIRRKRGEFIGPRPPFGYCLSKDKKVLTVDDTAAQYVKRIFGLACMGYSTGKIAKKLNEERIPTPGDYKNQEKPQYHIMGERGYWNSKKVLKILENKVYTGTMVNGKYKVTKVGAKKFRRVPDEQLISVPNKHEAIITEQDFQKALEVIKNRGCQRGKIHNLKQKSVLLGKLRCGNCRRSLLRIDSTTIPYFTCETAKFDSSRKCFNGRLKEPEIEAFVLQNIIQKLEQSGSERDRERKAVQVRTDSKQLERKIDFLKTEKQRLYEQFKMKKINRKIYLEQIEILRSEEAGLQEQMELLHKENPEQMEEENETQEIGTVLTREMVEELIDTIYISGEKEFEIVWKW